MTLKRILKVLAVLVVIAAGVSWLWFAIQMDTEETKRVDEIFAECPAVKPWCAIRKTQNGKFANVTRVDFERHACPDGRVAYRETSRRMILSTYEMHFADFSSRIRDLAAKHSCVPQ